ncbi:MAG TPA: hypothetical protein RMH85_12575 [Polyangiaceae bacterium LLY-WYZ-15_(1-7)]|nr:hypothetical protein [Myxococcales bacterium]MAT24203.1 hypothetical protein [Sandaracinus sp.]HJL04037.1 hypothetical protein [Polyangiaceae bacterium LLY-WYZ-15_(1-7)]MBJ73072.1 hypothetical protein [Sandaracinus sp.]HJL09332.1 hypothetical protein [Polyangiaceae bacterium LLY-WYZ-15_(1-7)]
MYRDDLETRRAHVRRLEERLAELQREEALLLSLPRKELGGGRGFLGGPRTLEVELDGPAPTSLEALHALCDATFEVDGHVDEQGGVWRWRGEPEPRPRQVEVRVEGGKVRVHDRGHLRWLAGAGGFFGFLGMVPSLARGEVWAWALTSGLVVTVLGSLYVGRRAHVAETRRRQRQLLRLAERLREHAGEDDEGEAGESVRARVLDERSEPSVELEVGEDVGREAQRSPVREDAEGER